MQIKVNVERRQTGRTWVGVGRAGIYLLRVSINVGRVGIIVGEVNEMK